MHFIDHITRGGKGVVLFEKIRMFFVLSFQLFNVCFIVYLTFMDCYFYLCFIDHEMRNVNKFANDFLICCYSYIIIFGISIWLFLVEKLFFWYSIVLCWITNFICAISILIIDKRQWLSKKKKRILQLMMDTMKRKN